MRYFMLVIGLLCTCVGFFLLMSSPPGSDKLEPRYHLLMLAGVVFLAAGMATIDIVEALKSRRE